MFIVADLVSLMPGLFSVGVGVFVLTIFFSLKAKVSSGIHLNTWNYSVCSIRSDAKVMRLHRTRVNKKSLFIVRFDCYYSFVTSQ